MGDRSNCTLRAYGMITRTAYEKMVEELDKIGPEEVFDASDGSLMWCWDGVNYAEASECGLHLVAMANKYGVSFGWWNEAGRDYGAGVEFYRPGSELVESFAVLDGEIMVLAASVSIEACLRRFLKAVEYDRMVESGLKIIETEKKDE